jgi:CheY-like chemotaxis protein
MRADKIKILIADDEAHVRLIVKAYFAPYNAEFLEARNGREALEILEKNPADLVVLDYTMPVVNGEEVLKKMSDEEKLRDIPVIVYTAGGFEEETEKWLKVSSMAFIEKTNLGEDLIQTAKDILGDRLKMKK